MIRLSRTRSWVDRKSDRLWFPTITSTEHSKRKGCQFRALTSTTAVEAYPPWNRLMRTRHAERASIEALIAVKKKSDDGGTLWTSVQSQLTNRVPAA